MSDFIPGVEEWSGPDFSIDRDAAIEWARQIMEQDFVVLDTETTGLGYDDVIVSVGVVAKNGQILIDSLINPGLPIPPEATAVHDINDAAVADSPRFSEVLPKLDRVLRGKKVLIYNEQYDTRMLLQSANQENIKFDFWWWPPKDWKHFEPYDTGWYCVMEKFAEFYGEWNDYHGNYRWQRLSIAADFFGLDISGAHGAVADCLMTLGIVKGMAEMKLSREK